MVVIMSTGKRQKGESPVWHTAHVLLFHSSRCMHTCIHCETKIRRIFFYMLVEKENFLILVTRYLDYRENDLLNIFLAPGTYCPEKVNLDRAPQYSFGRRTSIDRVDHTPGKQDIFEISMLHRY